jgi:hypothetical protein
MIHPSLEGFFADRNPYAVQVSGPIPFRAGSNGLAVARFGWGDVDTGFTDNVRTNAAQVLAYVFPVINGNSAVRVCRGQRYARPGVGVTLMRTGNYVVRFPAGAVAGQPVYASSVDGTPISGVASNAEATRWQVVTDASPGGLAIISTTTQVTTP